MNLWKMSAYGAVLILVIAVVRLFGKNRLPKRTFLILWGIALLRLLVPFSISSPVSVYALVSGLPTISAGGQGVFFAKEAVSGKNLSEEDLFSQSISGEKRMEENTSQRSVSEEHMTGEDISGEGTSGKNYAGGKLFASVPVVYVIWTAGLLLLAGYFMAVYFRCRREFRTSLPVESDFIKEWEKAHMLLRPVAVRQLDRISTPLTYGMLRPVILLPKAAEWTEEKLSFVLEHEFIHIKRLDAVTKLLLTAALCLHWFNPFVWLMYMLFNRDIELSCDEAVVRHFGESSKSAYALTLISMEEKRSGLMPLYNGFGKEAIEERIRAVMKGKKPALSVTLSAIVLVLGIAGVFATSAGASGSESVKKYLTAIPGDEFTEEESEKLFSLWLDGYGDMSVSEFQKTIWALTDSMEDTALVDRFYRSELAYEIKNTKEAEALNAFTDYFYHVLIPLTARNRENRSFNDYVTVVIPQALENPVLEYALYIKINDAEGITCKQYEEIRQTVKKELEAFLGEKTLQELEDEDGMAAALEEEAGRIEKKNGSAAVNISLECSYRRLLRDEANAPAADGVSGRQADKPAGYFQNMASYYSDDAYMMQGTACAEPTQKDILITDVFAKENSGIRITGNFECKEGEAVILYAAPDGSIRTVADAGTVDVELEVYQGSGYLYFAGKSDGFQCDFRFSFELTDEVGYCDDETGEENGPEETADGFFMGAQPDYAGSWEDGLGRVDEAFTVRDWSLLFSIEESSILTVENTTESGKLDIRILHSDGTICFEQSDMATGTEEIELEKAGTYIISICAKEHTGSFWFKIAGSGKNSKSAKD